MSDVYDDGEFMLPSQFLTEEDILNDFDISTPTTESTDGFNSGLGSPADSVTETESDEEEDFVAGLTRRLSRSSLVQKRKTVNPKERDLSDSPKSTLQQGNSGSGSSPTGPISPPPAPAYGGAPKFPNSDSLNLLEAAAGEVAKLSVKHQGTGYFDYTRGFPASQRKQTGPVPPPNPRNPNFSAPPYPNQSNQQLQAFQFQQFWNREMMMKQQKKKNGAGFFAGGMPNQPANRPLGLPPAAWPTLQHAVNPNNRNVFAAPAGMKRESVGTGVFLPRMPNATATHIRRNLNKFDSGKRSPQVQNSSGVQAAARRNSDNARSEGVANLDIQLPSEWTY